MKTRNMTLVKGFRQSTPYVNAHRNKTMVIMLSGETVASPNFTTIIHDIALLHSIGVKIILVHGARPQINQRLAKEHYTTVYHKQIRVTDSKALEMVMQAAGQLQLAITAKLSMCLNNTPMAGTNLNIVSGNFIIAQPLGVDDGVDYCHTGKIRRIDHAAINATLDRGSIVLLGPIASSVTGESFNLLSEEVATQTAIRLHADKLIGFCAEQGILDEHGEAIAELFPHDAERLLQAQPHPTPYTAHIDLTLSTQRFLSSAIVACRAGVPRCHLISYQEDGALLQELFSIEGIGTQIVMASAEQVRTATIDDIGGLLDLIRPLEKQGILVRRSREQLEQEIKRFTLIEKDNLIIGCVALYPYPQEKMAEMACLAIHNDYRESHRGLELLNFIKQQAKRHNIDTIFILTTRSLHWFREQGFYEIRIEQLPMAKQNLYNFQRNSKILALDVTVPSQI